jgi:hypothetical protein
MLGIVARTAADPERFEAATQTSVTLAPVVAGSVSAARVALSHDDTAGVWRIAFDEADYPYVSSTRQTWSSAPVPAAGALAVDAGSFLHDANHALHPELHLDGTQCTRTCPQGAVLQPSKAIYPPGGDAIFYYSGFSTLPGLQVNGQRCIRAPTKGRRQRTTP